MLGNAITDNGTLNPIAGGRNTLGGMISGSGTLNQTGTGVTILTASNSYSGGTFINRGALVVSNMNALGNGNVTLNDGWLATTLGLGKPVVVNGDYTQNGGTLALQLFAANQSQVVQVSGSAILNSGTLAISGFNPVLTGSAALTNLHSTYTLLTSAQLTGSLTLSNPFPATGTVMALHLTYPSNTVQLSYYQAIPFDSLHGLTPNQFNTAVALDNASGILGNPANGGNVNTSLLGNPVKNDPLAKLFDFLDLQQLGKLPHDYDLIAPEELSSMAQGSVGGAWMQMQNLNHRLLEIRNGQATGFNATALALADCHGSLNFDDQPLLADNRPAFADLATMNRSGKAEINREMPKADDPWAFFAAGSGQFTSISAGNTAGGYDLTTAGVTIGADYRVSNIFSVGVLGSYQNTSSALVDGGSMTTDGGRGALYALWHDNGFYAHGAAGGGYSSYSTSRAALNGLANGSTSGGEIDALLGGGYDHKIGKWILGPTIEIQYTGLRIGAYNESGSLAPLSIQAQDVNSLVSRLGAHLLYNSMIGKMAFTPELALDWQHEYLDSQYPITSSLPGGIGGPFTVQGPTSGADNLRVNVGFQLQVTRNLTTFLYYNGMFGRQTISNGVNGGLSFSF